MCATAFEEKHGPESYHNTNVAMHKPERYRYTNVAMHRPERYHNTNVAMHRPERYHYTNVAMHVGVVVALWPVRSSGEEVWSLGTHHYQGNIGEEVWKW